MSLCLSLSLSVSLNDLLFAGPACLSSVMRMINYDDDDAETVYCEAKRKRRAVQQCDSPYNTVSVSGNVLECDILFDSKRACS